MQYHSQILKIVEGKKGTYLKLLIPGEKVSEEIQRVRSGRVINSELRVDDNRHISALQRRKVYAIIKDISLHTGHEAEFLKEYFKYDYCSKSGEEYFSLSNCTMTTARYFITYLIEFCFLWDIPMLETMLKRTDDINAYLYLCLKFKKCAICNKKAEKHHWDSIGMGNNRNELDDSKHRKLALCEDHHRLAGDAIHNKGRKWFEEHYHVYGIVYED